MRFPRILLLLWLIITGKDICSADDMFSGLAYDSVTITLIANGACRVRYFGSIHPSLDIGIRAYSKYIELNGDDFWRKGDYKITLFHEEIPDAEAKAIFDSAIDTLRHFQFSKPGIVAMDGSGVTLSVEPTWGNSMQVAFDSLGNCKDASPGIARIIEIADAHAYKEWTWSKKLPAQLTTDIPPHNRKETTAALAHYFPKGKSLPTVRHLLTVLGRPDGFSKQFGLSKTKGSTDTSNVGGTLRILMDDGSEILAWTPDFKRILFVSRFGPKPDEEGVIYWTPPLRN